MPKLATNSAAAPTNLASSAGPGFDEFVGTVQIAYGGADVPPAHAANADSYSHHPVSSIDHAGPEAALVALNHSTIPSIELADQHSTDAANSATISSSDSGGPADLLVMGEAGNTAIEIRSVELQHPLGASAADFADQTGSIKILTTESHTSSNGGFDEGRLANLFDQLDQLTQLDSPMSEVFSAPVEHVFGNPGAELFHTPQVTSDARGHGGGGGGGGGTVPPAYTTNSGTGVNIHLTFDSSVGSAPAGFVTVVENVANFFASSFTDTAHPFTINIAVGFGEVDGMRLGPGALGESVTNLLSVSAGSLAGAYSGSSFGWNSLPSGNLYVSTAEGKALNLMGNSTATDGWVGFSGQSGIFAYGGTVSSNQYDFYGTAAHEFSEVMGRILLTGASINGAPSYMAYDLFHYFNGVQDFAKNGGYLSLDHGTTDIANFNNVSGGDAGDWLSSGGGAGTTTSGVGTTPSGGSPYDAFNAFGTPGVSAPVTHTDLLALQAVLNLNLNSAA